MKRRWQNGFRFQAGYTFAKSIDETSNSINRDFVATDLMPNPYDFRSNRGLSDFDIRHAFTLNGSYQIPTKGLSIPARILGGWDVHGLLLVPHGPTFFADRRL